MSAFYGDVNAEILAYIFTARRHASAVYATATMSVSPSIIMICITIADRSQLCFRMKVCMNSQPGRHFAYLTSPCQNSH